MIRFVVAGVVLALVAGAASAQPGYPVPEHFTWKKHPKGTKLVARSVLDVDGKKSESTTETTLVEIEEGKVVLESWSAVATDGKEVKTPATRRNVVILSRQPAGWTVADWKLGKPPGAYEEGTEALKIGGTEFKTRWYKYRSEKDGNKTEGKVWVCDDVPGQKVKEESATTGKAPGSIKWEVVEIKKP